MAKGWEATAEPGAGMQRMGSPQRAVIKFLFTKAVDWSGIWTVVKLALGPTPSHSRVPGLESQVPCL